jgi:hypothetical protein
MKDQQFWLSDKAPHFRDLTWIQYASRKDYGEGIMEKPEGKAWPDSDASFIPWGKISQIIFKNGFGLSVIRTYGSYGGDEGLYEAGVLCKKTDEEYDNDVEKRTSQPSWYKLTYDTEVMPIDVSGYLTEEDVTNYLVRVWAMNENGTERALQPGVSNENS